MFHNLHGLSFKKGLIALPDTSSNMASLSMVASTSRAAFSSPLRCACRAPAYSNNLGRRTLFGFGGSKKKQKSDKFQDGIPAAPARPTLSQDDLFHPVRRTYRLLAQRAGCLLTPRTMMLFCSYRNRPFQRCARRLLVYEHKHSALSPYLKESSAMSSTIATTAAGLRITLVQSGKQMQNMEDTGLAYVK